MESRPPALRSPQPPAPDAAGPHGNRARSRGTCGAWRRGRGAGACACAGHNGRAEGSGGGRVKWRRPCGSVWQWVYVARVPGEGFCCVIGPRVVGFRRQALSSACRGSCLGLSASKGLTRVTCFGKVGALGVSCSPAFSPSSGILV